MFHQQQLSDSVSIPDSSASASLSYNYPINKEAFHNGYSLDPNNQLSYDGRFGKVKPECQTNFIYDNYCVPNAGNWVTENGHNQFAHPQMMCSSGDHFNQMNYYHKNNSIQLMSNQQMFPQQTDLSPNFPINGNVNPPTSPAIRHAQPNGIGPMHAKSYDLNSPQSFKNSPSSDVNSPSRKRPYPGSVENNTSHQSIMKNSPGMIASQSNDCTVVNGMNGFSYNCNQANEISANNNLVYNRSRQQNALQNQQATEQSLLYQHQQQNLLQQGSMSAPRSNPSSVNDLCYSNSYTVNNLLHTEPDHILQPSTSTYGDNNVSLQQHKFQNCVTDNRTMINDRLTSSSAITLESMKNDLDEQVMLNYVKNKSSYDCIVTIFHAKVAQKSYGNEKRFFTPPPTVYLHGGGWQRLKQRIEDTVMTEMSKIADGQLQLSAIENAKKNGKNLVNLVSYMGIRDLHEDNALRLDFSAEDFTTAKSLHISDADRRKYFILRLNLMYDVLGGSRYFDIGSFESQRIKVISKPTKRRVAAAKNTDCTYQSIASGIKVAFYNRVRSQTGSTRFLQVEKNEYNANQKKWGAFKIHLLKLNEKGDLISRSDDQFEHDEGTIHYNDIVQIVDAVSARSLPPVRIRKVENEGVLMDMNASEPVNQLHKCALELFKIPHSYICVSNDTIGTDEALPAEPSAKYDKCQDGAIWIITAAHMRQYRFYEPMSRRRYHDSVGPVPVVTDAKLDGEGTEYARLFLDGQNFDQCINVWLGCTPIITFSSGSQTLDCPLPGLGELNREGASSDDSKECYEEGRRLREVTFPVTLVRKSDNIIYSTDVNVVYSYKYTVKSGDDTTEEIASAVATDLWLDDNDSFATPAHVNAPVNCQPSTRSR